MTAQCGACQDPVVHVYLDEKGREIYSPHSIPGSDTWCAASNHPTRSDAANALECAFQMQRWYEARAGGTSPREHRCRWLIHPQTWQDILRVAHPPTAAPARRALGENQLFGMDVVLSTDMDQGWVDLTIDRFHDIVKPPSVGF